MGVMDNGRSWTCSVYVYDLKFGNPLQNNSISYNSKGTYPNTNIKSWKITDTMSANGDVAFGSTGSKALTLELIGLADKDFGTGAELGIVLGGAANAAWYFFVDSVDWTANFGSTTTYSATVTAYDAMYYASSRISDVALPPTYEAMINNGKATVSDCRTIAQYCIRHARYDLIRQRAEELYTETGEQKYDDYANMYDSTLDTGYTSGKTMDDVVSNSAGKPNVGALTGYTELISLDKTVTGRSLLGRMAAMAGKRALCNNTSIGNIAQINFVNLLDTAYNGGNMVAEKDVYDNGFKANGKKQLKYLVSGTTENPASAGKKTSLGYSTMAINCPDMTTSRLTHIYNNVKVDGTNKVYDIDYELGSVKFRGDPALKAGMKVSFPDAGGNAHNTIATKVVSNYDGGFYQTVYSEGKSDSDIQFEQNHYAENATEAAEQKDPDAGGGGGTPTLIYYSESESPDSATIDVDGITVEVDNSGTELQAQNYNLTLDKTGGYSLTNGGNEFMTLNSTEMLLPGFSYLTKAKINFGDSTLNPDLSYSHTTNVGVHGNFGARNICTNTISCGQVAVDRIGFRNINSGSLSNPAYYWRLDDNGGQGAVLTAIGNMTFDLSQASNKTMIKTNQLYSTDYARTINLYAQEWFNDYDNPTVSVRLGGGNGTNQVSVSGDKVRFQQVTYDYTLDPNNPTITTTTITMDLTATNINDLFTFQQVVT